MRIKKGDPVEIIAGKDKGKRGTVARVMSDADKVVVEGANIMKKHRRATRRNSKGQVVEIPAPIHVSNVMLVDPKTDKPTRVRHTQENGKKVRVATKSGAII